MELTVDKTDRALFAAATRVAICDGRKASFWHSSWIDGQAPASLFPLLFRHSSRRKNRTVREAVLNGKWISDIAYNLNAGLLSEFFILWRHIQSLELDWSDSQAAQEDQITWTLESSGGILCKLGLHHPIQRPDRLQFSKTCMDALGTPTMQIFPVAATTR